MAGSDSRMYCFVTPRRLTKADKSLLMQRSQDISREELFQQFGRLESANTSLEQAVAAAQEREKQLRSEQSELNVKKGELTSANAELRQALKTSKAEVARLKEQMTGLQSQIGKMEKTIKVQSEQISKKPEVNIATPQRHNPAAPPFVHQDTLQIPPDPRALVYGQTPPVYNSRRTQPTSSYAPPTMLPQQSSTIRAASTSSPDPFTLPALSRQHSFVGQSLVQYGTAPVSQVHDELSARLDALVLQTGGATEVEFPTELNQLFQLSEAWARNFANVPDTTRDKALPRSLTDTFCRFSHTSLAFGLLSSGSTRYFLIAKVINKWVTDHLLKHNLVRGYSFATDNAIGQAKKMASEKETSMHVQRACIELVASTVKDIQDAPDFQAWLQISIDAKAAALWKIVSVLLAPGADTAWADFKYLISEAHRVGLKICSVPLRVTFEYPEVGSNSYFEPSSMLSRDANLKGDPKSWKRQQMRVKLGITPVVVTTDLMGDAIIPKTVHLANVLLMQKEVSFCPSTFSSSHSSTTNYETDANKVTRRVRRRFEGSWLHHFGPIYLLLAPRPYLTCLRFASRCVSSFVLAPNDL